jgi:hypothetical protein
MDNAIGAELVVDFALEDAQRHIEQALGVQRLTTATGTGEFTRVPATSSRTPARW